VSPVAPSTSRCASFPACTRATALRPRWGGTSSGISVAAFDRRRCFAAPEHLTSISGSRAPSAQLPLEPGIRRSRVRIDAVCYNALPEFEVVFCHKIADALTTGIRRLGDRPGITQGLLNRIDAQIHGNDRASQFASDPQCADAWKASESYQFYGRSSAGS